MMIDNSEGDVVVVVVDVEVVVVEVVSASDVVGVVVVVDSEVSSPGLHAARIRTSATILAIVERIGRQHREGVASTGASCYSARELPLTSRWGRADSGWSTEMANSMPSAVVFKT